MNKTVQDAYGSLTYDDKVIQKIVTMTLGDMTEFLVLDQKLAKKIMSATAAANARMLEITMQNNLVHVSADIIVEYGCNIPSLYETAAIAVKDEIERMTALTLGEMHLYVRDILPVADFHALYHGEVTSIIDNKTIMAERSFSTRINHFVRSIKERAIGMGDRAEGENKGERTKTKLFSKKGEGKTREFVTNLETKTTNVSMMEEMQEKASTSLNLDQTMDFSAIDARNINSLEFSDVGLESKQVSQVTEDVFHKIDSQKTSAKKK